MPDPFKDYPSWSRKYYTLRLDDAEHAQLLALRDDLQRETKGHVSIARALRIAIAELAAFRGCTI